VVELACIAAAREVLRARQARYAIGLPPLSAGGEGLAQALAYAAERRAAFQQQGEKVFDGWFSYDAATEATRWDLTDAIIRRVAPGPFEDPRILAVLARQAASIEYVLCPSEDGRSEDGPPLCEGVLLGTTGEARNDAMAERVGDCVIIALSAGMIDCLYQFTKANVISWKRVEPPKGRLVAFSADVSEVAAGLDANPYPVDFLVETLVSWLYQGVPRLRKAPMPALEYHGALQLAINGAERFVLAHEYGHAFLHQLRRGTPNAPAVGEDPWDHELQADTFAVFAVARSAAMLDDLPANIALQGAVLAMKAHEVLDAALDIAKTGTPQSLEDGSTTHPPLRLRMDTLEEAFRRLHPRPDHAERELQGMLFPGKIGDLLLERVIPRLQAFYRSGLPLHPIWS
jgi:hypothetical protein